jgi:hypothetical protein
MDESTLLLLLDLPPLHGWSPPAFSNVNAALIKY